MDYRVSWSPEAVDDVEAIAEYIERDSPIYARAVVQKLLDAARDLNTLNFEPMCPIFIDRFRQSRSRPRTWVYRNRMADNA